jgi:hypothetical protein
VENERQSVEFCRLDFWYHPVMEPGDNLPAIQLHSHVLVELVDTSGETLQREFTLVNGKQADFKSGLLDENTPLGRTLLGHHAGELLPYVQGDLQEVRILSVAGGGQSISSEAAQKRRADVHKAEAQSEITSQMIFSTASGSKWGDYEVDLDKLLEDEQQGDQQDPQSPSKTSI